MINFREMAEKRIRDDIRATLQQVKLVDQDHMFNNECHRNSLQWVKSNPHWKVVLGIYIDEGCYAPLLHCWCYNPKTKKHLEVTLGHEAAYHEYYPIKMFDSDDRDAVLSSFDKALKVYRNRFVRWYEWPFVKRVL